MAAKKVLDSGLEKARQTAQQAHAVLVLLVRSESGDQDRLRDWYLKTGWLVRIPTRKGKVLANWLVDKRCLPRK
jgi:hypothetical protein